MQVGVLGAGAWGINHVRTLHQMGRLAVVIEPANALQDRVRSDFPDIPVLECLDALWANTDLSQDIQSFVIATPVSTHADLAVDLFAHGKHVLVEKPMALTTSDCEKMMAAAEQAKKTLMVGHLLLFQPAIQFIKQYLDEGKLGQVYTLTQRRSKLGRARRVENALWSFGVHDVAVFLYIVGQAPVKVNSVGHSAITVGVEDDVHLHLNFANGIVANLHNSWLWPRTERELIVVGEKGILVYDELQQEVVLYRKGIDRETLVNIDEGETVLFAGAKQPLQLELEHFLHCCETGDKPLADGQNGLDVVGVLEKCEE